MGGDIFIQIYTGVSTRPSTSRPLLAAYAVRRNAYEACGAPTCLYHGVCMHTWIIIARKKFCRFKQLLKIISRADYLLAISHVCNRSTGNPEPTIPSLPTQFLLIKQRHELPHSSSSIELVASPHHRRRAEHGDVHSA